MKTIASIAFIASVYSNPVIAILTVIVALFVASIIASFLAAKNAQDAELDQHYAELKNAFDDVFADEQPAPQDDIWETTETSCDFICPVSFQVQPVLALPAAQEYATHAIVINYAAMTYKELQQLCKAQRKSPKDIKLNSKKSVLINWLKSNS